MSLKSYCDDCGTEQEHKHTTDFTHLCVHTRLPIIPSLISISLPLTRYHHLDLLRLFTEDDGRSPKPLHLPSAAVSCCILPSAAHATVVLRPSFFTLFTYSTIQTWFSPLPRPAAFRYPAPVNMRAWDPDYTKRAFNDIETHSGSPNGFETIPFGSSGWAPSFAMKNWRF